MSNEIWYPRPLSTIERKEPDWLWRPFIPNGTITTVAGEGNVGKSPLVYDILARITRGDHMPQIGDEPEQRSKRGTVIIFTKEDDPSYTVGPRMEAAEADMRRVMMVGLQPMGKKDIEVASRLDTTAGQLEKAIVEAGDVRAVLFDPITDFAGDLNLYREDQARKLLTPLSRLAAKYRFAAINVLHLVKGSNKQPRERILGSVGLVNISRSVLMVGRAKNSDRRLLMMEKANFAQAKRSVAFAISSYNNQPVIDWEREYANVDVAEIISGKSQHITKQEKAENYLRVWLAEEALPKTEVKRRAEATEISWGTFRLAQHAIGVKPHRKKGSDAWWWSFPIS